MRSRLSASMSRDTAFDQHRPMLLGIASRMLGNAPDADDVVQDAFVRWQATDAEAIDSPRNFLATIVTRLCLDHLKSARRRHEELRAEPPDAPGTGVDPEQTMALADALSAAFFVLLDRLTPVERAVFLLVEGFDFSHAEIAAIVGRSEESCRQLLRRARQRLATERPSPRPRGGDRKIVRRFLAACIAGDVEGLLGLLTDDAVLAVESAGPQATYGRVRAFQRPIRGAAVVARFLVAVQRQAPATIRHAVVESLGVPAVLMYERGRVHSLLRLELEGGRIRRIGVAVAPVP